MTLGFLMIVLTFLDSGELSAAFVNTPTLEECEARGATVRTILEEGNVTIEQLVCRASQAQFEPFMHGGEEDAERHAYVVAFDDERARVEPVADCDAARPTEAGRYCVTSTQKQLSQAQ